MKTKEPQPKSCDNCGWHGSNYNLDSDFVDRCPDCNEEVFTRLYDEDGNPIEWKRRW